MPLRSAMCRETNRSDWLMNRKSFHIKITYPHTISSMNTIRWRKTLQFTSSEFGVGERLALLLCPISFIFMQIFEKISPNRLFQPPLGLTPLVTTSNQYIPVYLLHSFQLQSPYYHILKVWDYYEHKIGINTLKYASKLKFPFYDPLNQWLPGATYSNQGQTMIHL